MKAFRRILSAFLFLSILLITSCSAKIDETSILEPEASVTETSDTESTGMITESSSTRQDITATYSIIADAFDWGPASTKAILSLSQVCQESDLCSFQVTEIAPDGNERSRTITDVYLSDENGNKVSEASSYISIDMDVFPCSTGSVLRFDMEVFRNVFSETYALLIKPSPDATGILSGLIVEPAFTEMITPDTDTFDTGVYADSENSLQYALFTPEIDDTKHPLIIWLHGQGEGGVDPNVALLGNRVTAFAEDDIQEAFQGAYVLVPQCPTYWPESTPNSSAMGTNPDGSSAYTGILMGLIEKTISDNQNIDTNRIYIGGCSMGGYMTMTMLLTYPDYFAAAFPVCAYYPDSFIDDEELLTLTDIPLWYIYCSSDSTVSPEVNSAATISRLQDAGATIHTSVYEDVRDTTGRFTDANGEPFLYNSHWVWMYVFNSECKEGEITLWNFLAEQVND